MRIKVMFIALVLIISMPFSSAMAQEPQQTPEPPPTGIKKVFAPFVGGWTKTEIRDLQLVFWTWDGTLTGFESWIDFNTGRPYPNRQKITFIQVNQEKREIIYTPLRPEGTPPGEPELGILFPNIPWYAEVNVEFQICYWHPFLLPPGSGWWECRWANETKLPWGSMP